MLSKFDNLDDEEQDYADVIASPDESSEGEEDDQAKIEESRRKLLSGTSDISSVFRKRNLDTEEDIAVKFHQGFGESLLEKRKEEKEETQWDKYQKKKKEKKREKKEAMKVKKQLDKQMG